MREDGIREISVLGEAGAMPPPTHSEMGAWEKTGWGGGNERSIWD